MKQVINVILIVFFLSVTAALVTGCDTEEESSSPPSPPETPVQVNASDGSFGNQVQVRWQPSQGADSYRVFRAIDDEDAEYRLVAPDTTANEWVDDTVSAGRFYYYRIVAVNMGGKSPMSDPDLGYAGEQAPNPPPPPSRDSLYASQEYLHHVYLRWDSVYGADTYHVYMSVFPAGEYIRISPEGGIPAADLNSIDVDGDAGTTNDIFSFDDNREAGSVEGRACYYRISAENDDGEGAKSDVASGWFPYDVPGSPPGGVAATDDTYSNKVVVSWSTVTEADYYSVYRSTDTCETGDCPVFVAFYENIGSVSGLTFDDDSVSEGEVYCYAVRAVNAAGSTDLSVPDKGGVSSAGISVPSAPLNVSGSVDEENQISITWNSADTLATQYNVYRCMVANGNYGEPIGSVTDSGITSYTYIDTVSGGISTDTVYYYKVSALNDEGESSLSVNTHGRALPTVPSASAVVASDGSDWDGIPVSWTEAARAVAYILYRSESAAGPWDESTLLAENITGTAFVDVTPNITSDYDRIYYYAVRGVNSAGEGEISEPDAGNVELGTPENLATSDGGAMDVTFSWDQVEACQGYIVYWQRSSVAWGTNPGSVSGEETILGNTNLTITLENMNWYFNYRFSVAAYMTDSGGNIIHTGPVSEWTDWELSD